MICMRKKSRGHEKLEGWRRFGTGVCAYLCLIAYSDQSGIRLWQHLALAVHHRMSRVVAIRIYNISNINNSTHLCDLVVHVRKNKGTCKTGARVHLNFVAFWKAFLFSFEGKGIINLLTRERIWLTYDSRIEVVAPAAQIRWVWLHFFCFKPQSSLCKCKRNNWRFSQLAKTKTFLWISSHTNGLSSHAGFTMKLVLCGVLYSKNLCLCMVESEIL